MKKPKVTSKYLVSNKNKRRIIYSTYHQELHHIWQILPWDSVHQSEMKHLQYKNWDPINTKTPHTGGGKLIWAIRRAPPINSLELGPVDMHLIAWRIDGLKGDNSDLICLFAVCLSILPNLLKKAIAITWNKAQENQVSRTNFISYIGINTAIKSRIINPA